MWEKFLIPVLLIIGGGCKNSPPPVKVRLDIPIPMPSSYRHEVRKYGFEADPVVFRIEYDLGAHAKE